MIPIESLRANIPDWGQLSIILAAGPWCWPLPTEQPAWQAALQKVPSGLPPVKIGQVPLVSINASTVNLWSLTPKGPSPGTRASFGETARAAWRQAALALPHSLPLLWQSLESITPCPIDAQYIGGVVHLEEGIEQHDQELEGESFGLSFFLAMASQLFEEPIRPDCIASATVDSYGHIGTVDAAGLRKKIKGILTCSERFTRILVAHEQVGLAEEAVGEVAAGRQIKVIGLTHTGKALQEAFSTLNLVDHIVDAGFDKTQRLELINSFFRMAMRGKLSVPDWGPVAEAASLAQERWTQTADLEPFDYWRLSVSAAIAKRYHRNQGAVELNDSFRKHLRSLPLYNQIKLVAHLLQQSTDTCTPPPEASLSLAEHYLPLSCRPETFDRNTFKHQLTQAQHTAFLPHLQLMGAMGRLLAVCGTEPHDLWCAMLLQKAAAQGFVDILQLHEASYPLAELYRLSGVLEDRDMFEQTDELHRALIQQGGLQKYGRDYVDLAQSKAVVMLNLASARNSLSKHVLREELSRATSTLLNLCHKASSRELCYSAARWWIQAQRLRPKTEQNTALPPGIETPSLERLRQLAEIEERTRAEVTSTATPPVSSARCVVALCELDQKCFETGQECSEIDSILTLLSSHSPGLMQNLRNAAARQNISYAAYVAKHYPY